MNNHAPTSSGGLQRSSWGGVAREYPPSMLGTKTAREFPGSRGVCARRRSGTGGWVPWGLRIGRPLIPTLRVAFLERAARVRQKAELQAGGIAHSPPAE
jgi:hypothetical protein